MSKKISLAILVAASATAEGFMYATEKDVSELVKHGYAEVNKDLANPADAKQFAVRATEAGVAAHNRSVAADNATDNADDVESDDGEEFAILDEPLPATSAVRVRESKYPFDKLAVGQSFKVMNKPGREDAFNSMASSVANANRRYSEEVPGEFTTVAKGKYAGKEVPVRKQIREFKQVRIEGGTQIARVL